MIVATTPTEAARLIGADIAPAWARTAAALRYEPIVTLTSPALAPGWRSRCSRCSGRTQRPVQFVFDHGQLGGAAGLLTLVVSGAAPWLERGPSDRRRSAAADRASSLATRFARRRACCSADRQARDLPLHAGPARPPMQIADGLRRPATFVDGPYPATLEGAVRSGLAAARAI